MTLFSALPGILQQQAPAGGSFVPTDISGIQLWLDGSDAATITETGGAVSAWNDKSGNTRHYAAASGKEPTLVSAVKNGNSIIRFDGSTDGPMTATWSISQPFTLFVVCVSDVATTSNRHVIGTSTTCRFSTNGGANAPFFTAGSFQNLTTAVDETAWHVYHLEFNGASSEGGADGTVTVTGNIGTNGMSNPEIGARGATSDPMDGDLAEIIIYNSILGASDFSSVVSYLGSKWAITVA